MDNTQTLALPRLIQAGMGIHISSAQLANTTSRLGALGVVSSAALRHIFLEDVRKGDELTIELTKNFPIAHYREEALAFAPGGAKHGRAIPVDSVDPRINARPRRLSAVAAYVEVMRAKQGHHGKVGINVMWKTPLSVLPSIYGAMLAGVDALLCGAGVPMELPDIVARIRAGQNMEYLPLTGTGTHARFDFAEDGTSEMLQAMPQPHLLPIVSNFAFCKRILDVWRKEYSGTRPFAFVLENHAAGGHNAPPRNRENFSAADDIESYFDRVLQLEVPVYVAGAFEHGGTREDFEHWTKLGAYGIQVGSRFALCSDSGMRDDLRKDMVARGARGELKVETSPVASPTGYPIKIAQLAGTIADPEIFNARKRACDKKYLLKSHFQEQADGTVKETYICSAMPAEEYARLGGDPAETEGKMCLCNGLLSTAGYFDDKEPPVVTLGMSGQQVEQPLSAREIMEDILTPQYVAEQEQRLAAS